MQHRPLDVPALAALVAERAVALADPRADAGGRRYARVAVDGPVPQDTALLAGAVSEAISALGRPVARVRAEDFLRPRSVRLEAGPADPDTGYERWVDHLALRREVLDPLGPGGRGRWLPTLWDAVTDRATRAEPHAATPGTVAVVDGPFLLRWETADAFDVSVHLVVSEAAVRRRLPPAEADRMTGAWRRYTDETWPQTRADLVVRFDRPAHPALVLASD